jgi:hypothetical protein
MLSVVVPSVVVLSVEASFVEVLAAVSANLVIMLLLPTYIG